MKWKNLFAVCSLALSAASSAHAQQITGTPVARGEMPAQAADVSVFIGIIGMPMMPLSDAGVARRSYRRAWR